MGILQILPFRFSPPQSMTDSSPKIEAIKQVSLGKIITSSNFFFGVEGFRDMFVKDGGDGEGGKCQ